MSAALCCLLAVSTAFAFDSRAPRAYLYDVNTRTVLYARNETEPFAPASLTKIITANTVQNLVAEGAVSPDETFLVSEDAWRRGGAPSGRATMFAEINSMVRVEDLLTGLVVMAANDAAIALAQGVDGTEEAFARRMTARAAALGATDSTFTNATGADDPAMRTTARDLGVFAAAMIAEDPEAYALFGQADFTWNDIFQRNRNPLYREISGTDGLMAGFTEEAGYGAVGSVERDGRRIVFVLSGMDTAEGRVSEAERLVDYAFEDFRTVRVAEPGEAVARARLYGGAASTVPLTADGGALDILLPREGEDRVRARVVYNHPFPAPVSAGQPIARLLVERDGTIIQDTPLVAAADIGEGNMAQRARDGLVELLTGWIPPISFAGNL
ncbi:MAG: D-alanyl-D-alanine carboxypeptidase [Devosiaceae bacterium]|nr:D-alanyl-D-alanine carboxypeptidase [Devosiaceae bacterium MH13]